MTSKSKDERKHIGYLGECIVQLELAYERLIIDSTGEGMVFDFIASNGATLEIKTSRPRINKKIVVLNKSGEKGKYEYKNWKFRISPEQNHIDFYVLVALNDDKEYLCSFIIPNGERTGAELIVISENALKGIYKTRHSSQIKLRPSKWDRYKNNWKSILNYRKD